jgi:hypothetical protein
VRRSPLATALQSMRKALVGTDAFRFLRAPQLH